MGINRFRPTSRVPAHRDDGSRLFIGGVSRLTALTAPVLAAALVLGGVAPAAFADDEGTGLEAATSYDEGDSAQPSAEPAPAPKSDPDPEPSEPAASVAETSSEEQGEPEGTPVAPATVTPTPTPTPSGSGKLKLWKDVVNDDGGTALASDWLLQYSPDGSTWTTVTQGQSVTLPPGLYYLRESGGPDGYDFDGLTCDSNSYDPQAMTIQLKVGDDVACTFHNNDKTKTRLWLKKLVTNDDGGTALPGDWTLEARVEGGDWFALSQADWTEVEPGTYELRETGSPGGYVLTSLLCDDDDSTTSVDNPYVTLHEGDDVQCGFVNDDTAVDVGIVKTHSTITGDTVEAGQQFSWYLEVTNHGSTTVTDAVVTDEIPAGLTVTDVIVPLGWVDESVGSSISVRIPSLAPGQSGIIEVVVTVDEPETTDAEFAPPGTTTPTLPDLPGDFVNTACVEAESDENPDNDCSTDTVKIKAIVANVWVSCINDAPFLMYEVRTTSNLEGMPISLLWEPTTGTGVVPAQVTQNDIAPNVVTRLDWPGVKWDANGVSIDWPGWRPLQPSDFGPDGLPLPGSEVYGDSIRDTSEPDEAWRQPTLVTFSVNPTISYFAVYPPSTPQCAVVPTLAATGSKDDSGALLTLAGLLLFGGAILSEWSRRRRTA